MNGNSPISEIVTPTTNGVLVTLGKTRSAIRRALVIERLSQAIAFGLLAIVVAVLLDRLLRLPLQTWLIGDAHFWKIGR